MYITKREAHESGRDYALRVLKENIINLVIEPGSMVSEKELAAELGLSRGPVREAMAELSKVKMVEVYPQRGNRISLVDYDLVDEARFMRVALEIAVAERCCLVGLQPEYLGALRENLKLQEFYLEERDTVKLLEKDNEFHRLLFFNANAMQIYNLMNSMLVHFDRVRAMALRAMKDLKLVEDHRMIFDAINRSDPEAAKQAMSLHLSRYQIEKEAIRAEYPQYLK